MSETTAAASRGTARRSASEPSRSEGGPRTARDAPADGRLDRRYQALSDPKRRRILALLREGERCVCELVDALDVGQSLLSFHLKTLKEAGLVADRREGRWVHYRTRPEALAGLRDHLSALAPSGADASDGGGEQPYRCC